MSLLTKLRQKLLSIDVEETKAARRGFSVADPSVVERLEKVGATFLSGYHAVLAGDDTESMASRLDQVDLPWRGFAYEGAAMACVLLDELTPWNRSRFRSLLEGAGAGHCYMLHVGAGWAFARLPWRRRMLHRWELDTADTERSQVDPLLRWLVLDGWGFHDAYFHVTRTVRERRIPNFLTGYAVRVYDQGIGRCLWFVEGASVESIAATIASFKHDRRSDLWAGVGLACTYAGEADAPRIELLRSLAGSFRHPLAQGAAFAAKARQRAGNPTDDTVTACRILCGLSVGEAAAVTDRALPNLPDGGDLPAYEVWRHRICNEFAAREDRWETSREKNNAPAPYDGDALHMMNSSGPSRTE